MSLIKSKFALAGVVANALSHVSVKQKCNAFSLFLEALRDVC